MGEAPFLFGQGTMGGRGLLACVSLAQVQLSPFRLQSGAGMLCGLAGPGRPAWE